MRCNLWAWCLLVSAPVAPLVGQSGVGTLEVLTEAGTLRGVLVADEEVRTYRGVPYAAPPVEDRRWRPPEPPRRWDGVRSASEFGPSCETSEDCLYLNIWTPAEAEDTPLPVMVWIHGGGFSGGGGDNPAYDGTAFAQAGVVLVTINYRLHFFGAFAHPELSRESPHGASGNYSLLDQIAALRWIRDNIAAFGGDPGRVTIFGQSAGGRSVSVLMVSPLAEGLFHRGIGHSGALRDVSYTLESRETIGVEISTAVGCEEAANTLSCLRSKSLEELMSARSILNTNPIIDGWVIPEDPVVMYARGLQHDIPMIIGSNADEATFWFGEGLRFPPPPTTIEALESYFRELYESRAEQVLAFYRPTEGATVRDAFLRFQTDIGLGVPARMQARWMTNVGSSVYLYFFSRVPPDPVMARWGASHSTETRYVFDTFESSTTDRIWGVGDPALLEEADHRLSRAMMTYWVRFAATGDPNVEGLPDWPEYDLVGDRLLELGPEIAARPATRGGEDLLQILLLEIYLTGEGQPPPIAR